MRSKRAIAGGLVGILLVSGLLLVACAGGSGTTGSEAIVTQDGAYTDAAQLALEDCERIAKTVKERLEKTAMLAFLDGISAPVAVMEMAAYDVEIEKLAQAEAQLGAESIVVCAFREDGVCYLADSRYGEPEDYFTKYSCRVDAWEESGYEADRTVLLAGKELGYASLVGGGKYRYTLLSPWLTEGNAQLYLLVTLIR